MSEALASGGPGFAYRFSWRDVAIAIVVGLIAFALFALGIVDVKHFVLLVAALPLLAVIAARPEWGIMMLFVAAVLDIQGRLVNVAGVQFTIYQAIAAFLLVVFIMRYRRGELQIPSTPLDLPLIAFLAIAAASIVVAPSILSSTVDWISLLSSVFLMYAIVVFADTEDKLVNVVWAAIAVATVLAVFGLLERASIFSISGAYVVDFTSGIRPTTTFKDTNVLGMLMYVSLAMCVPLLLQTKRWALRALGVVAIPLCLGALWATHSRGAWIASIVVALVLIALVRMPWAVRVTVIVALVALGLGFAAYETEFIQERFVDFGSEKSAMSRVYMAQAGLEIAADRPFGIGLGGFPDVYPLYRQGPVRVNLVESHMAYLTLLTEMGLLGLLAYLWILWRFFRSGVPVSFRLPTSRDQALLVGSIAAVAGVVTQALTYSLEGHKLLWFALGVGMAVYVRYVASSKEVAEA